MRINVLLILRTFARISSPDEYSPHLRTLSWSQHMCCHVCGQFSRPGFRFFGCFERIAWNRPQSIHTQWHPMCYNSAYIAKSYTSVRLCQRGSNPHLVLRSNNWCWLLCVFVWGSKDMMHPIDMKRWISVAQATFSTMPLWAFDVHFLCLHSLAQWLVLRLRTQLCFVMRRVLYWCTGDLCVLDASRTRWSVACVYKHASVTSFVLCLCK